MSKTNKFIDVLKSKLDIDNEYTLKDIQKLVESAYKEVYGKSRRAKSLENSVRKPPSEYNIFIRNEISNIRKESPEGVDPKDYMKLAAKRWQEHKLNSEENKLISEENNSDATIPKVD